MKNKFSFYLILFALVLFGCSKEMIEKPDSNTDQNIGNLKSAGIEALSILSETEPNNSLSQANGPVSPGTTLTGTINSATDEDWFAITCTEYSAINLYLDGTVLYILATVYDKEGNFVAYANYRKNCSFTPTYSGSYYVKLTGYSSMTYNLNVTSLAVGETEPNNTMAQANPVNNNFSVSGILSSGTDQDWYKMNCVQDGSINIYLDGPVYYIAVAIYDNQGVYITNVNYRTNYLFVPSYTGTYYFKVTGYSGLTYTLSGAMNGIAETEPNNTFSTANGILTSKNYFQGTLSSGSDIDFAKIKLANPTPVTFYLKASASQIHATLYNSNYDTIADMDNDQAYTFANADAGTYYVKISGSSTISYLFIMDPLYSIVSSVYFDVRPKPGTIEGPVDYKSSAYSFLDFSQAKLGANNQLIFPDLIFYITPYWENSGDKWPVLNGVYPNGFPLIWQEIVTGK